MGEHLRYVSYRIRNHMNWNYRVIRTRTSFGDLYQVHEVCYADNGDITAWTENSINPAGETLEELKKDIYRQLAALEKPVLDYDDLVRKNGEKG